MCAVSLHGISQVTQNNKTNPSSRGNFPSEHKLSLLFSSALFGPVRAKKKNQLLFEVIHSWKPADSALHQHPLFCDLMTRTWTAVRSFPWSFTLQEELPLKHRQSRPCSLAAECWTQQSILDFCPAWSWAVSGQGQLLPARVTDTTSLFCPVPEELWPSCCVSSPNFHPVFAAVSWSFASMDTVHTSLLILEAAKLNFVYISDSRTFPVHFQSQFPVSVPSPSLPYPVQLLEMWQDYFSAL